MDYLPEEAVMAVITTEGWVPNEATARIGARVDVSSIVGDIDWDAAVRRLGGPPMPDYVRSSIHGIAGGYSSTVAASTWDPVVREIFAEYVGPEPEHRDRLCGLVEGDAATVLDVACGTGESSRAWRRRFPRARITAVDVSPFMLAVAERKLIDDAAVEVRCLNAEHLPFPDASFDVVTASLLFHELPLDVSPAVLAEMRRVCRDGGRIAVMEPYQIGGRALKPIPFPEPYLKDYLSTDWDDAFTRAGFGDVETVEYGEGWMRIAMAASQPRARDEASASLEASRA
jgi:ubiquinone/menaquinone biosynthesis C-methylase UbiE